MLKKFLIPCQHLKINRFQGDWVAQSVRHPTSAQVVISWFLGLSPASGLLPAVWNLLQTFCPPLPVPRLRALSEMSKNEQISKI